MRVRTIFLSLTLLLGIDSERSGAQTPPAPHPNPPPFPTLPDPGPAPSVAAWPANGVALCDAPGEQDHVRGTDDYAHGAYFAWNDLRGGDTDVYATRIGPDGRRPAGWTEDGVLVAGGAGHQRLAACVNDGPGGVFIAWIDEGGGVPLLFVQRLTDEGEVASGWPAGGRRVCPTGTQRIASIHADRRGGLQIAWAGIRDGASRVTVQHLGPDGAPLAGWPECGIVAVTETAKPAGCISYQALNFADAAPTWPDGMFVITSWRAEYCEQHAPELGGCICQSAGCYTDIHFHEPGRVLYEASGYCGETVYVRSDEAGGFLALLPDRVERVGVLGHPSWTLPGLYPYWARHAVLAGDGGFYVPHYSTNWGYVRLLDDGSAAPGWSFAAPVPLCEPPCTNRNWPQLPVPDGSGGIFVAWSESRAGISGVYATHILADGTRDPRLPASGFPLVEGEAYAVLWSTIGNHRGSIIAAWIDRRGGDQDVYANRLVPESVVGVAASLVSTWTSTDRVEIVWSVMSAAGALELERRDDDRPWRRLATMMPDGAGRVAFVDHDVRPGARYWYRLTLGGRVLDEVSVELPAALSLSFDGARPNPTFRDLRAAFTLADEHDVVLRVTDVAGRVVRERSLSALGPGHHSVNLGRPGELAPGTYFLDFRAGDFRAVRRAVVVR